MKFLTRQQDFNKIIYTAHQSTRKKGKKLKGKMIEKQRKIGFWFRDIEEIERDGEDSFNLAEKAKNTHFFNKNLLWNNYQGSLSQLLLNS